MTNEASETSAHHENAKV